MSTFLFKNKKTGEEETVVGTIAEAEAFQKENPDWDWMCGLPLIHSGAGMKRPDTGFRELLTKIKKGSGRSNTINTF